MNAYNEIEPYTTFTSCVMGGDWKAPRVFIKVAFTSSSCLYDCKGYLVTFENTMN